MAPYAEKADAGEAILALCKEIKSTEGIPIGSYRGFQMELSYDTFEHQFQITLKGEMRHRVSLGTDARGNLTRLDNALAGIPARLERGQEQLENLQNQQTAAQVELAKPLLCQHYTACASKIYPLRVQYKLTTSKRGGFYKKMVTSCTSCKNCSYSGQSAKIVTVTIFACCSLCRWWS